MNREGQVKVLLLATLVGAGLLYALTAADGYPWSASTHWALAWSGALGKLPVMAHPVWGYFVRIFGGHYIAMSVTFAALADALIAGVVTRHFGWRVGIAAALFAIFAPPNWNAAVTGSIYAAKLLLAGMVLAVVDIVGVILLNKFRQLNALKNINSLTLVNKRIGGKWERITAWTILGVAAIFMVVSLAHHNYALGEDATEYVEGVLKDVDGKWVVMSGVADDQFYAAVRDHKLDVVLVSLRRDDINRRELVERVRAAFPDEPALAVAAEIGPREFVSAALKAHPELLVMSDMERTRKLIEESGRAKLLKRKDPPVAKLVEWNNEMAHAMDAGDMKKAGEIAREILSQPKWRAFVPANAIMGTLSRMEGNLVASERFFRAAFASGEEQPLVVYNDFAETLRQLKQLDEAEKYARIAVEKSGPKGWMARLTLAQILADKGGAESEIRRLAKEARPFAPSAALTKLRRLLGASK